MNEDDKTLRLLEQLLAAQPDNWEVRVHLARLYLDRGRHADAERALTAPGQMPDDEEAHLLLASALSQTDRSRAIAEYQAIIAANKKCARAYLGLARLYRESGLRDEARKAYGIATVIDEKLEDPEFRAWLGEQPPVSPPPPPLSRPAKLEEPVPSDEDEDEEDLSSEACRITRESDGSAKEEEDAIEPEASSLPIVTFKEVGGMEAVKERIRMNIIYPFKNPAVFQKFKKRAGGGILLYGPPGCGKTYIARATAGECGARFMSIGITDVLSKWIGESEQRLHELFELGRRTAPTVVFIDELDALGMSRANARGTAFTTLINQLLVELDGIQGGNENLMVLAATNAPWNVDSAFRRPGRFDRVLFVPPPDDAARRSIFEIVMKDLPHETVDYDKLVKATRQFSGADIRGCVDRAAETAIYEEMKTGKAGSISTKALLAAVKEARPSTVEWLETAKDYANYSNRAGQYDDLVQYFRGE